MSAAVGSHVASLGAAAEKLALAGIRVFPAKPRDKKPLSEHGCNDATTDVSQLKAWWAAAPEANVAIATGEGLVAVDIDPGQGGDESWAKLIAEHGEPVTAQVTTGGGGRHLYFKASAKVPNSAGKLGPGLDVRGDGGYVIAPPSVHPNGSSYQWLDPKVKVADLPEWLGALLIPAPRPPRPQPATGAASAGGYGAAALRGEVDKVMSATDGTRNSTLNDAAFSLGQLVPGGHLTESDVEGELLHAALGAGLPEREALRTIGSGLAAGKADPRTVPASVSTNGHSPGRSLEESKVVVEPPGSDISQRDPRSAAKPDAPEPAERTPGQVDEGYELMMREQDRLELASWSPVDLAAVLAGDTSPLEPTQLTRADGVSLLYPGRLHDFHGEPETLKSLTAQLAVAQVLLADGTALYVDHEAEARDVIGHLLAFNVPPEVIVAGLTYIRPSEPLRNAGLLLRVCPPQPAIAVIDGVDAAMAMQGLSPNVAIEYRQWLELEVRPIQRVTAGGVVMIDHVAKNKETRGDWAAGTYQKRAAIDGASFGFELVQPFGVGRVGVARIMLAKDRPGALRGRQGVGKEIARLRLESHHPADPVMITWELLPPPGAVDGAGEPTTQWMPTGIMERVSRLLEGSAKPLSKNEIETAVPGKAVYIRQAIDCLVEQGYADAVPGDHRSRLHRSIRPYREDGSLPEPTSSPPRPDLVPVQRDEVPRPSSLLSREGRAHSTPQDALVDVDLVPVPGRSQHIEAISQ